MAVHDCPMSRISKYECPFCQSRKASSPLTTLKERTKNKTVNFPHETILNLHILLQVVCHSFASLISDTFLSFAPKTTFPRLPWLLVQAMRDNVGRLKGRREGEVRVFLSFCFDWHLLCGPDHTRQSPRSSSCWAATGILTQARWPQLFRSDHTSSSLYSL